MTVHECMTAEHVVLDNSDWVASQKQYCEQSGWYDKDRIWWLGADWVAFWTSSKIRQAHSWWYVTNNEG